MNFEPLLKFGVDQGASAIHLQAGSPPQLRIGGLIRNVESAPLTAEALSAFITSIVPNAAAEDLDRFLALGSSFSATVPAAGRFRCAAFHQVGGPGLVLRVIPATVRSIEELHLPPAVHQVALATQGLVLIVGPAGSGRTTTLAAMVDAINAASYRKIVTVEAPVESLHTNKKSLITQMDVGLNASSLEHALAIALQQDADVIALGDVPNASVAQSALGAAESGRKVLAVMAGLQVIPALTRLIAMIPSDEREMAVSQLAGSLDGVIAQRLAKTRDGALRPVVELLRGGVNTSRPILENRIKDLSYVLDGRHNGMQTLDQHLINLHQTGAISGTEAMRLASNPEVVGAALRAPRPAAAGASTAEPGLVPADTELLP